MSRPKIILVGAHQHVLDANKAYLASDYDIVRKLTSPEDVEDFIATEGAKPVQAICISAVFFKEAPAITAVAGKEDLVEKVKVLAVTPDVVDKVGLPGLKTNIKEELLDKPEWYRAGLGVLPLCSHI